MSLLSGRRTKRTAGTKGTAVREARGAGPGASLSSRRESGGRDGRRKVRRTRLFYPDWIVKFKDGRIGIFDTKGGATAKSAEGREVGLRDRIAAMNAAAGCRTRPRSSGRRLAPRYLIVCAPLPGIAPKSLSAVSHG